jgi:integrase
MAALAPEMPAGMRDHALLLLGFSGAFRRSELVALTVADLIATEVIRKSKTDQEAHGQEIVIPAGGKLRTVEAVKAWLPDAEITSGPVFRSVAKGGRVPSEALTDRSVANIVKL